MRCRFEKVGTTSLGSAPPIPCDVYDCAFGGSDARPLFHVHFLCPEDPGRVPTYYPEPLLRSWRSGKPTDFLDRACASGRKILRLLDPDEAKYDAQYKLAAALFRNRYRGRIRPKRWFNSPIDFVDFSGDSQATIILPGFGGGACTPASHYSTPKQRANHFIRQALGPVLGMSEAGGFPEIRDAYEWLVEDEQAASRGTDTYYDVPPQLFPLGSELDHFFTEGFGRTKPWKQRQVELMVMASLFCAPEFDSEEPDKADLIMAVETLSNALNKHKRQSDFDAWLKNVREHKYLELCHSRSLKGNERQAAAQRANRIWRHLLWRSYQLMGRCYGALMMCAYLAFCLEKQGITDEERSMFRHWHYRQVCLGGLPVDFLERYQLRWIAPMLRRYWHEGSLDVAQYDCVSHMLGLVGQFTHDRRLADRTRKQSLRTGISTLIFEQAGNVNEDIDHVDIQDCPVIALDSRNCGKCGGLLNLNRTIDSSDKERTLIEVECAKCGVFVGRMNLLHMARAYGAQATPIRRSDT